MHEKISSQRHMAQPTAPTSEGILLKQLDPFQTTVQKVTFILQRF